ncbi:MAG TPA: hypothetical protein VFV31_02250 [Chitinophagaceae bacterium]|nr:hypothetical protein [Chitinophagaceae bacterium]
MAFDKLSGLPEWEDDEFDDEDNEGEEWKPKPTKEAAKAMYEQWKTVMIVLKGALGTTDFEEEEEEEKEDSFENDGFPSSYWKDHKAMIMGDAYQVAVKIKSSEAGLYMIRMENACLIRKNAQSIKSSMLTMIAEKVIEESHGMIIREEIDKFRMLFRHWVSTFERDEFEDEWGLF